LDQNGKRINNKNLIQILFLFLYNYNIQFKKIFKYISMKNIKISHSKEKHRMSYFSVFAAFLLLILVQIGYADNSSITETIHPENAFIVIEKELSPLTVEQNKIINVTLNIKNTGNNLACSIEIVDFLDDNFILVPGSVEIYSNSISNCHLDNQYANPNRVVFKCDWLKEWTSNSNNATIKFNLTSGSNVRTTRNLSEKNHINIVNVTAYYGSYNNGKLSCTDINDDALPMGIEEQPNNETGEPGAEARRGNMTDSVNFTVIPASKIFVTKTISEGFSGIVEIGDHVNFTVNITNLGAYPVTINSVNDVLPTGFTKISMSPSLPLVISPGEAKNISIEVLVGSGANEGINTNFVNVSGVSNEKNISATATAAIFVKGKLGVSHLIIEKYSVNPTVKKIGGIWEPAQYRITIRNVGTGKAYNVTVTDTLPQNWTITSMTSSWCEDNHSVSWNNNNFSIDAISSGASCSFTYTVGVSPGDSDGLYVNTARVSAYDGTGDIIQPSVEDSAYTYLLTQAAIAALQVTKTSNNVNPEPGDEVNFTINLCNPLTDSITNITVTDYLPYGFEFVNATNTTNITLIDTQKTKIIWEIGVLEQGMTNCKQIGLTTKVNSNVTKGVNVNTVFAEGKIGNSTMYGAANLLLNVRKPAIYVKKSLSSSQNALVMPGENVTYQVEIGNIGDAVAYNVSIEDIVPFMGTDIEWNHTGMPFEVFPEWCNVSRINNTFYFNSSLSPMDICTFKYNVTVSVGTGDGQYENTVKAWAKDKANGSIGPAIDTASVFIRGFAALEVIKKLSSSQIEFQPGDTVGFNISISNRGQGQISKISIVDTMPYGFKFDHITCPVTNCYITETGTEIFESFDYTLNPGDTIIVQIFANVTSNASAGSQANKVTVTATKSDGGQLIDKDIAMVVVKKPYLLIEKWTPTPTKVAGTAETYLIRIKNIGAGLARNITVFDTMPVGFVHVSSDESPRILSGACKNISVINNTQNATFIIEGELNETQECVFQYTVDIAINVSDGSYPNFATLSAKDNSGTDISNQTVVAYVFVVKGVAVEVKKTANASIAQPGDVINFTIEISNKGDSGVNVSIDDILPYGFYNLSEISWTNVNINAHSVIQKYVIAKVNTTAPEFNLNRVVVSGTSATGTFNVDDFAIVIVKKPYIILSKKALTENSYSGGDVTYEISVLNEGDATASVIYITDKLPDNFSFNNNSLTNCSNFSVGVNLNSSNEVTFNITNFPKGQCKFYFTAHVPDGTKDGLYGNTIYGNYSDNANGSYTILPKTEAYVSILSVTAVSKLFVVKEANKNILEPGDNVTFTINVTNPGLSSIGNVYVEDYMPLGFNITSCETNNGNLTKEKCNESVVVYHGLMPAETTITIYINTTVLSNATEFTTFNKVVAYAIANNTVNLKSEDVLLLTVNKPHLDIEKWVEGNTTKNIICNNNSTVTYTIKLRNTGSGKAYNISIYDSMIEFCNNTRWCSTPPNPVKIGGDCTVNTVGSGTSASPSYFNVSDLPGNSECVFMYNLTIPAIPAGLYQNNATVYGSDNLGLQQNDTDEAYFEISCCAGTLIVRKEMDKIFAQPGDVVKATIYVDAIGSSFDVVVRDVLPYGWNYINASVIRNMISIPINCSQNNSIVNCSPFHMEKGSESVIELNLSLNSSIIPGNNVNLANVSGVDYLNNSYVRTSSAVVYVDKPSISITKSVDQYQVEPGAEPTFTLVINNPSIAKIYNISVKDYLPTGLTYVANSTYLNGLNYSDSYFSLSRVGNYNTTGENITWFIGDLDAKAIKIMAFKVHVKCNVTKGDFFNIANVSGVGLDNSNVSATSSIRMTGYLANATLIKYASKNYVTVGDYVDYTIVIHNLPNGAGILPLTLEDDLPANLFYVPGYAYIGDIKAEPSITGKSSTGYILKWNLSSYAALPSGSQLSVKYRTKVGRGINSSATNYVLLTYLDPPPLVPTQADLDHIFKTNATSVVACYNCSSDDSSDLLVNYTIPLHKGWNLISIPIMPKSSEVLEVLDSISGKYTGVYTFTDNKWSYMTYFNGEWFGDLYVIEHQKGYWINMKENVDLNISGYVLNNTNITLNYGWNLIGCPSLSGKQLSEVLNQSDYTDVYTYNTDWIYSVEAYGTWFGSLKTLNPGKGYWINMKENKTICI